MAAPEPPVVYVRGSRDRLIDVIYDRRSKYDLFWYHWPSDGFFFFMQNYEPVAVIHDSRGELCMVVVRRGWQYVLYEPEEVVRPIQVSFEGINHHPFIVTRLGPVMPLDVQPTPYQPRPRQGDEIPSVHLEGLPPRRKNIYEKLDELAGSCD